MASGPSRIAEAIVGLLIPPACREEVLGDLHERFQSRWQYAADVLSAIPLVILSRMRRIADPQILLIQAFVSYLSFLAAAWLADRTLLYEQRGFLRLAIPAILILLGLILDDTYAKPGQRSAANLTRGPLLGVMTALASQGMLWAGNTGLALPAWIACSGCAMSFLLSSAVRLAFPPLTSQLQGANAPVPGKKQESGSPAIIVTIAIAGTLILLMAYQMWKRG